MRDFREQVERWFEHIDRRFEQIDRRFEQVDRRFEQVHQGFLWIVGFQLTNMAATIGALLSALYR